MAPARLSGRTLLTARWVVGHRADPAGGQGGHALFADGEVVVENDRVIFVGHGFPGAVARRLDFGNAMIAPGFVDLDALSDLDTTILGFDNQPAWKKGRVWPEDYLKAGPFEMLSEDDLVFQKRYAFASLLRNGITTALPIASLFYRAWGETRAEFEGAAAAAEDLGLRVYLGPAYRTGNQVLVAEGQIEPWFDEARGLESLAEALTFARDVDGQAGGLVRAMLAPDRIETCTPELLTRTAAAAREMGIPVRLHCCQSKIEYEMVVKLRGMSPPEWLESLGFFGAMTLLPHATWVSGVPGIDRPGRDLEIIRDHGATVVHCPLVSGRHGNALRSFTRYREMGLNIAMGTDTAPPDMIMNMQVGIILARVMDGATACRSEHYFDAATVNGADALRRPDLGRLAPGSKADLIVVDFDRPHIGQQIDPIQTLLLAGHGRDVRHVMVDGRWSMFDGVIPGVDEAADKRRAQDQFEKLMALYPVRTWGHPPVEDIFSSAYPVVRGPVVRGTA